MTHGCGAISIQGAPWAATTHYCLCCAAGFCKLGICEVGALNTPSGTVP
jgi:hypothetical protein